MKAPSVWISDRNSAACSSASSSAPNKLRERTRDIGGQGLTELHQQACQEDCASLRRNLPRRRGRQAKNRGAVRRRRPDFLSKVRRFRQREGAERGASTSRYKMALGENAGQGQGQCMHSVPNTMDQTSRRRTSREVEEHSTNIPRRFQCILAVWAGSKVV